MAGCPIAGRHFQLLQGLSTFSIHQSIAWCSSYHSTSDFSPPKPPIDLSAGWSTTLARHVGEIDPALDAHPQWRPEWNHRRGQGTTELVPSPILLTPCRRRGRGRCRYPRLIAHHVQRSISSSGASTESPMRLNMAAAASTALAIGSVAWYYHLYGSTAHAMTPAEEG